VTAAGDGGGLLGCSLTFLRAPGGSGLLARLLALELLVLVLGDGVGIAVVALSGSGPAAKGGSRSMSRTPSGSPSRLILLRTDAACVRTMRLGCLLGDSGRPGLMPEWVLRPKRAALLLPDMLLRPLLEASLWEAARSMAATDSSVDASGAWADPCKGTSGSCPEVAASARVPRLLRGLL